MRREPTPQEHALWQRLRMRQVDGLRFRRQAPIGPYIADFFCPDAKIIIELDGSGHADDAQARHDRVRDAWFAARGYRVVRVWNTDVTENIAGVLEAILAAARG